MKIKKIAIVAIAMIIVCGSIALSYKYAENKKDESDISIAKDSQS